MDVVYEQFKLIHSGHSRAGESLPHVARSREEENGTSLRWWVSWGKCVSAKVIASTIIAFAYQMPKHDCCLFQCLHMHLPGS
ncbi:hypothetical protein Peur_027733 [Populus x canadensis]